jgi:hypothetical protein
MSKVIDNIGVKSVIFNEDTDKAILEAFKADNLAKNKWKRASDLLKSLGVMSYMIDKKSDRQVPETMQKVNDIVWKSFSDLERACYLKKKDVITDVEQVTKRFVQTETASRYSKIVSKLKLIEEEEIIKDDTKGAQTPKAGKKPKEAKAQVAWYLDLAIRTLQALTNPEIGVNTDIKTLQVIEAKYKTTV